MPSISGQLLNKLYASEAHIDPVSVQAFLIQALNVDRCRFYSSNLESRTSKFVLKCLSTTRGRVAQLGERIVRNDEVAGSTPVSSTKFTSDYFKTRMRLTLASFSPSQMSNMSTKFTPQRF
jgi:hypothetical protein